MTNPKTETELQNELVENIARAYGIPAHIIGKRFEDSLKTKDYFPTCLRLFASDHSNKKPPAEP